jgi:anti-anti-sigma factor
MLLEITERQIEPGITHLVLTGKLALGREGQRLETIVSDLSQKGVRKAILDLTNVEYIDSSGVGIVALSSGRFKEAGGKLVIVAPEGRVLHVLRLAGVDGLLTITPTLEAASAAVA